MTAPVCVFVDDPLPTELSDPAGELGGKGLSLRRLHEAGLRVPCGFTISASVCRAFLSADGWPAGAWPAVEAALDRLVGHLAEGVAVGTGEADKARCEVRLAVRSGAAVSMPGLLKTLLDVPTEACPQTRDGAVAKRYSAVRGAVEEVFRSWNSPATVRFRQSQAIDPQMATAVNVQEMIDCIASGVMFTRYEGDSSGSLVIEAVVGSGESLVSGRVTPLRWVLCRDDREMVEAPEPGREAPAGLAAAVGELVETGLRLEEQFAAPLDIEWGLDGRGLVFFQARSVAGLPAAEELGPVREAEITRLQKRAAAGSRCWVRHNLSETLSQPTPLTWSVWRQFMSAGGGLGRLYRRLGYRPAARRQNESFLTLIGGRIYSDPDRALDMFGEAWPWTYDIQTLRTDPSLLDQPPRHFDPARLDPWFLWRLPALLGRMWHSQRRIGRLMSCAIDEFERQTLPQLQEFIDGEQQVNLADLKDSSLLQRFEKRRGRVMDEFAPRTLLPGTLGGIALAELTRQVSRVIGPDSAAPLVREISPAGDMGLIRRQQELLVRWDEPASQAAFLEEFGQRAIGEMELAVPRWRETPELIDRLAAHPKATPLPPAQPARDVALERLRQSFADAGAASLVGEAAVWFDHCWELLPYRDRGRHIWLKGYELLRHVTQELSRRFELGDDFYYLTPDEWPELFAERDVRSWIAQRRCEAAAFRCWHLPAFIDATRLDQLVTAAPAVECRRTLRGTPLSAGYSEGRVWAGGGSEALVEAERVLVCEALEPSLVPLLAGVVAVVVQQGGTLSHGAILARQMGLPAVRLADATRLLGEGMKVAVDGRSGQVELLDGEAT